MGSKGALNPKPPKIPKPLSPENSTWRFMGSYKWSYKRVINIVTLLITPLITTPEPPSINPALYTIIPVIV